MVQIVVSKELAKILEDGTYRLEATVENMKNGEITKLSEVSLIPADSITDGIVISQMSKRQKFFAFMCRLLTGWDEERATNLYTERKRIKGIRLRLYKFFQNLRWNEGQRLVKKYGTHSFR